MRVRRAHLCMLSLHDDKFLDVHAMLSGEITIATRPQLIGLVTHECSELRVSKDMLDLLRRVRSDRWISVETLVEEEGLSADAIDGLVAGGLLISDSPDPAATAIRAADESLRQADWHGIAALYHRMSAWRDFRAPEMPRTDTEDLHDQLILESRRTIDKRIEEAGPPPAHFLCRNSESEGIALERPAHNGRLYELLLERKSTRSFDREAGLPLARLNTLLYYVFGCHGAKALSADFTSIKKTSPSGGAMHPTEVYPLISRVEGLAAGLYHYRPKDHSLELLEGLTPDQASELVVEFSAWQDYFSTAHVCLLFTYRFARHNFKYPGHAKSYKVAMMDVAHLSQTAYLVCSELGIGGCFYGAINDRNIDERLGLDGITEGSIAAFACGLPDPAGDDQELRHERYDPFAARPCTER